MDEKASIPSGGVAIPLVIAAAAAIAGALVAVHYHRLGLTLSHYDARGHLVVARRIIDSLTPGWQQVGAVWLPLPHLLNMLPVQIDVFYQTGWSAVAISVLSFAVATGAIAAIVLTVTGSTPAAGIAAAAFALNPNVLYLQATPMTEPLLLALTTSSVALLMTWCHTPSDMPEPAGPAHPRIQGPRPISGAGPLPLFSQGRVTRDEDPRRVTGIRRYDVVKGALPGWTFALACLTRYEAWPVTVCALGCAVWARCRQGEPAAVAAKRVAAIAVYPALAIIMFLMFSRVVIGQWFVAGGFFVPENTALGSPTVAAAQVLWGTYILSGYVPVTAGATGLVAMLVLSMVSRRHASAAVVLSLVAAAALPWTAFVEGHPFRIRYMIPLIAVEALGIGVAAGLLLRGLSRAPITAEAARDAKRSIHVNRARVALVVLIPVLVAYEVRPLDVRAPMVLEAQWDRPNVGARQRITDCLGRPSAGLKTMASMASLGHYMQETSRAGFAIRDFLHEGNGDIWLAALDEGPRRFAEWVLIEEKAEGGDMLAERARQHPRFLDGYTRVCEGAGLALYRRTQGSRLRALNLFKTED